MDVARVWIWILLPLVVVSSTSSASLNENDLYNSTKSTEDTRNTDPDISAESTEIYSSDEEILTADSITSVRPTDTFEQKKGTDLTVKGLQSINSLENKISQNFLPELKEPFEWMQSHKNNTSSVPNASQKDIDPVESDQLINDNYESVKSSNQTRTFSRYNPLYTRWTTSNTTELYKPLNVGSNSDLRNSLERIMILEPEQAQMFTFVAETVHNLLKSVMLSKSTEVYVNQFNRRYQDLPQEEADNVIWRKYSRAVVESFVLEFCRNYPKNSYNQAYDVALVHLEDKKYQTALTFSVSVRRAADILKAILDIPIGIVQSKCKSHTSLWQCQAEYLARLTDESETCQHIWHHAHVHLTLLISLTRGSGTIDPSDKIIDELESKLKLDQNDDVNYLFDFIVRVLKRLRNQLRESLVAKANSSQFVKDLQSQDLLRCLNIDRIL